MEQNGGNEIVLRVDTEEIMEPEWEVIRLKHLGVDEIGLKLGGVLPNLWEMDDEDVIGPGLYDDDAQYIVLKVDYDQGLIWLMQI